MTQAIQETNVDLVNMPIRMIQDTVVRWNIYAPIISYTLTLAEKLAVRTKRCNNQII